MLRTSCCSFSFRDSWDTRSRKQEEKYFCRSLSLQCFRSWECARLPGAGMSGCFWGLEGTTVLGRAPWLAKVWGDRGELLAMHKWESLLQLQGESACYWSWLDHGENDPAEIWQWTGLLEDVLALRCASVNEKLFLLCSGNVSLLETQLCVTNGEGVAFIFMESRIIKVGQDS